MPIEPGEAVLSGDEAESRGQAAGVAAGDAVTIAGGEQAAAVDTDEFAGVAGENGRLLVSGAVVANANTTDADAAVVAGTTLSLTPEAGALGRAYTLDANSNPVYEPGPVLALSDEGGIWQGYDVPAGYAVVWLQRPPV